MYISDISIYLWFFVPKIQPRQRERNGAYIRQGKHLTYKLSKGKGSKGFKGGARLLEEAKTAGQAS